MSYFSQVFRGVPFAAPPVGPLRLKPPVACPPWPGVRPALVFGPACPQRVPLSRAAESEPADASAAPAAAAEADALARMPRGRLNALRKLTPLLRNQNEDCLYLNLYAPAQGKTTIDANYTEKFAR